MTRTRIAAAAGALLIAGAVLSVAGPAFADPTTTTSTSTSTTSTLAPCTPASSAPLYTARCAPVVSGSGTVTVTLPGVGSITFTVNPDGTVNTSTAPSVSVTGNNFSAGTPKVSADGTHIIVSFVNIASPEQHYNIKVKLSPPTSGGQVGITATAGPNKHKGHHHHGDDGDHEANKPDDHDADEGGPASSLAPLAPHAGQAPLPGHHGGGGD
jgi:hypothetical protein